MMMNLDSRSCFDQNLPVLSRKAYIFGKDNEFFLEGDLSALKDEWTLLPVRTPEDVRQSVRRRPVGLGILCLGKKNAQDAFRFLSELSDTCIRWIALLEPGMADQRDILRQVGENCFDFHRYPLDPERLKMTLGHAHGMARIDCIESNGGDPDEHPEEFDMVGSSPAMLECFRSIRKIAGVDACVLITGESGTGKELVARAIHERSKRASGPFVTLNCGAIPANLIQSELFGYEKGAFTGAHSRKIGHIEAANHGTIMLDEIGDMPFELQVNLLRVLQFGKIQRVGSPVEIPVDVRIIAATHIDLEKACREGRFREDLYYRLHVLRLSLPPLRDRGSDITLLARYFCKRFAAEYGAKAKSYSPEALAEIQSYSWPGNVRELINKIKSAVLMSDGPVIFPADLQLGKVCLRTDGSGKTLREIRESVERETIRTALQKFGNNVSRSARELGVTRTTLYDLLKKHNLSV
ncbi:MAG: sigma-54 dependent transcriptional regulator [Nitrospirae bacterium]|jgi:DNA-binding NtrC family response regulator|nr:sigma-54 dependent transcriptional regulator [Nitrospirota bacterium]